MSDIKYESLIDTNNKNNSHTLAYDYVSTFANGELLRVLEVGCSSGYLGAAIKSQGHTVWGVEPSEKAAAEAKEKLDFAYNGFIEQFISDFPDEQFDVVIFGDVLEHIAEPDAVLLQCHDLLNEGGAIVASVPNVAHIMVRTMLLEGRWEYSELGILDNTHLRFFNRDTIQHLFYKANYSVVDVKSVQLPVEAAADLCRTYINQETALFVHENARDDTKYDFQYVLAAVPTGKKDGCGARLLARQPAIKVVVLALNVTSSHTEVRMVRPLTAWADFAGAEVQFYNHDAYEEASILWADVVVIQRYLTDGMMAAIALAKAHHKKIIYESDDYILDLPAHLEHHKPSLIGFKERLDDVLADVDCATATTQRLADHKFKSYQCPVAVIPNCSIDDHLPMVSQATWKVNQATLIVASTDSVLVDFILPALQAIISNDDYQVEIVVIGPPGHAFDLAGVTCQRVDMMPYEEFRAFIRTLANPIGVIPLDDSIFSSCKTAVKFFDYAMAGIPVIASNVPPYSDVIVNNKHALLTANTTAEWVKAISTLLDSIETRQHLAVAAKQLVEAEYHEKVAVWAWDILLKDLQRGRYDERHGMQPQILDTQVSQLKQQVADLDRQLIASKVHLQAVYASNSWKLTKPIRYVLIRLPLLIGKVKRLFKF